MIAFIDEARDEHGVEPICKQLPIAVPPTMHIKRVTLTQTERLSALNAIVG